MLSLSRAMRRATRLTRSGKLLDATSTIQKALGATPKRSRTKSATKRAVGKPAIARGKAKPTTKRTAKGANKGANKGTTKRTEGFAMPTLRPMPNLAAPLVAPTRPSARARVKRAAPAPRVPEGARYVWRSHSGSEGTRRYRLYVPARPPKGERPLLVMLHGCTQGADDFARGTRVLEAAERHGMLVALPEQDRSANAMACWNWFEPAHQTAERGEPAILLAIIRNVAARHDVDRGRVFVAGLSAGGAMAAVLGATAPDLFAGIGVHSGLPYRAASDLSSAMRAMRSGPSRRTAAPVRSDAPRLFVAHGTADGTVSPRNADALVRAAGGGDTHSERQGRVGITRIVRDGRTTVEDWRIAGLGHAWSGGAPGASYTAPDGPDVTDAMVRFFLEG